MCPAVHGQYQQFPHGLAALDMPVTEAAAKSLHDLCDFVKQLHQHGVPVRTSRTDAAWAVESHCKVGAPVIKLIKYAATSALPPPSNPPKNVGLAGIRSMLLRLCCGK